jgi:diguanylate cyclase (GGDEF)-like protein
MSASSPNGQITTPGESYFSFLNWFARIGSVVVIAVGASVIFGWFLDIALLKNLLPGLATMKVNTACAFLAAGVALRLLHTAVPGSRSFLLARALSIVVAALGGLTLAEDLFTLEFGIDQIILPDTAHTANSVNPGRMAPATAFNFLLIGLALLGLKARQSGLAAYAHLLAVPPLFISTLAILGHAYGVSALYEVKPYTSMAIHTALSMFVLTLSLMAADPTQGIARIATSDTAGGVVCRRLLSGIPLILFAFGWMCLAGQQAGLYGSEFGIALLVLLSVTVCVVAVASTAVTLHNVDITRKRADVEISTLNAELEQRVQERTQQLAQLSTELSVANKSLEQLSLHDGLTDLANRRFFDTYLAGQIAIANRHKRILALVMCDVDAFKAYNDHYGHQAGDECLKRVAKALQSCCGRPADMVARYGGEEFAIVLPDTELTAAALIGEAARKAVARLEIPHAHSAAAPYVSISGGVAVLLRKSDMTAGQLITAADKTLFEAKHSGRNRMVSVQAEAA